jgi:chromosome partitioning protein
MNGYTKSRAKVVAISNKKGGSCKTTTAMLTGEALARAGEKVLIIDLDGQGNATTGLMGLSAEAIVSKGKDRSEKEPIIYDVFVGHTVDLASLIRPSNRQGINLDVLPACDELQTLDVSLVQLGGLSGLRKGRETASEEFSPAAQNEWVAELALELYGLFGKALEPLREHYDYILIDCPPGYGCQTGSALLACDCALIPLDSGPWSYTAAISATNYFDNTIQSLFGRKIATAGFLLCRFQDRLNAHQDVMSWLDDEYPGYTFSTRIRESTIFSKTAFEGKSLWEMKGRPRNLAADYECLAAELAARLRGEQGPGAVL